MDQKEQSIILDTNILQYITNKYSSEAFTTFLDELEDKKFSFSISSVTIYELLKGATRKTEAEMLSLMNNFKKFELSDDTLQNAAQLETLYKLEGIMPNQIEHGDKFIAATAILTNSYILTANARDFPDPYFIEVERKFLVYDVDRKRGKGILTSLLKPDIEVINYRIKEIPGQ